MKRVEILEFRECVRNSLLGFIKVGLPSGLIICDLTLHRQGARRWVNPPSRKFIKSDGADAWARLVDFKDRDTEHAFSDLVLAAFDAWQANGGSHDGDEL
jgi:hypothetical protein